MKDLLRIANITILLSEKKKWATGWFRRALWLARFIA
jgi:hypothetical protein